jgi:hypothetical protein
VRLQVAFAKFSHVYKCFFTAGPAEGQITAAKILTTGYSHTYEKVNLWNERCGLHSCRLQGYPFMQQVYADRQ